MVRAVIWGIILVFAVVGALVCPILSGLTRAAKAHDSWISRGGHRNAAGEWCCGEGDCFVLPSQSVGLHADGYHIVLPSTSAEAGDGQSTAVEIVPLAEAQTSPDGAYWRCKRPDGSRRCFFAPPPGS